VANAVDQSLRATAYPTVYQPLSQFAVPLPLVEMSLSVRTASGSPALLTRSVSAALTAVDRNLAFSFHRLDVQVSAARQQERLVAWLSTFFGALALLLAGIGLHGVMSYGVERQRVEIGIRMALGARREGSPALLTRSVSAALTAVDRNLAFSLIGFVRSGSFPPAAMALRTATAADTP
jgi:hypothetical protein